jgi:hypothetical protein
MNAIPIITVLAAFGVCISAPGHAAEPAKKSPATETTAPRPKSDTQPPLPIPPDHAGAAGETMKPPTDASMGAVDPKYKSGDPASPR